MTPSFFGAVLKKGACEFNKEQLPQRDTLESPFLLLSAFLLILLFLFLFLRLLLFLFVLLFLFLFLFFVFAFFFFFPSTLHFIPCRPVCISPYHPVCKSIIHIYIYIWLRVHNRRVHCRLTQTRECYCFSLIDCL